MLCINTFRKRPQWRSECVEVLNFLCIKDDSPPKSAWMASKLSTVLDVLQHQCLLLNELVAFVAALPPANNSHWATVGNKLRQLFSAFTVHTAIIKLLQSRTTQSVQASAGLDVFVQTLQAGAKSLEVLRVELFTTSSGQSTEDKSSPALTFPRTESPTTAQQVAMIPLRRAHFQPVTTTWRRLHSTMHSRVHNSPSWVQTYLR